MLSAITIVAAFAAVVGAAIVRPPKALPLRVRAERRVRVVRRS